MNRYFRSLAGLCLAFLALSAGAKEIIGRVVPVADEDTATMLAAGKQQIRVRLATTDEHIHKVGARA